MAKLAGIAVNKDCQKRGVGKDSGKKQIDNIKLRFINRRTESFIIFKSFYICFSILNLFLTFLLTRILSNFSFRFSTFLFAFSVLYVNCTFKPDVHFIKAETSTGSTKKVYR